MYKWLVLFYSLPVGRRKLAPGYHLCPILISPYQTVEFNFSLHEPGYETETVHSKYDYRGGCALVRYLGVDFRKYPRSDAQ